MTLDKTQTIEQYLAALPEKQRKNTELLLDLVGDGKGWVAGVIHARGGDMEGCTGLVSHDDTIMGCYALTVLNGHAYKSIGDRAQPLDHALATKEDAPCQ